MLSDNIESDENLLRLENVEKKQTNLVFMKRLF